ncbi:hypothetical protein JTB14_008472 [Gonioctena quinquepunctata]|nr:hypothetical protein JTB14_008472 [Gonioctena quinquepunctata]
MENFDDVLVEYFLEDDLGVLDFVDMGYPRRIFLRSNYYEDMFQMDFFRRFRLTKPTVMTLLTQIENQLEYLDDRSEIGDSGYPLRSYLMTPLANPVTPGENLYNEALTRTRNAIERVFGKWKRRFPVVAYGFRLKLETIMALILATTVLHNLARDMNEPEPPLPEDMNEDELNYLIRTQQINMEPQVDGGPVNSVQNEFIRSAVTPTNTLIFD